MVFVSIISGFQNPLYNGKPENSPITVSRNGYIIGSLSGFICCRCFPVWFGMLLGVLCLKIIREFRGINADSVPVGVNLIWLLLNNL